LSALADVNGQQIEVGDWVAYAAQRCDSSVLSFGRVWKVTDKHACLITKDKYDPKPSKATIYKSETSAMIVEKLLIPELHRNIIEVAYNERGQAISSPKKNVRPNRRKSPAS